MDAIMAAYYLLLVGLIGASLYLVKHIPHG